ncbi:MAG: hypothetical protein ABI828_05380 [Actinomycetota bacterium]
MTGDLHHREIRNPDGGMLGLESAMGRVAAHAEVLSHAMPDRVGIEVRDGSGARIAAAEGLEGGGEVGILRSWWNAEDGSQWTWTVELHNETS